MFKGFMGHNTFARKLVALTVAFCFLVSYTASDVQAAVDVGNDPFVLQEAGPGSKFAVLDVETFTIPSHLGEVRYSFKGDGDRVVVHMQDAHCNYFAQSKISEIINFLNQEYGVTVLNLEGGAGGYDLEVFTAISGGEIRHEVADYFLKRGEITGAEYFAINNPEKVTLWGIENKDLYLENLDVYRTSLTYKEEVNKYLGELTRILNNLKRNIYNPDLLKIDMAYNSYKEGNMDFREYLEFLIKKGKESAIHIRKFPNLYLLAEAMAKEDEVDFKKANSERGILIDQIKEILSPKEMKELIGKTVGFKTKRISRKDFYNYLLEKAKDSALDIKDFPALSSYIVYVTIFEAVDRFELMKEIDGLEAEIKGPLYENSEQRDLNFISRNLAITKNIYDFMMTKTDYDYYLANKDAFDLANFTEFINREAPKYRISAKLSDDISNLDNYRQKIEKFYEYSFRRDNAFLENMRFESMSAGTKTAIIMTGGFHTENLCQLFKNQGISYVSIVPRFTSEEGYESPYFDLLAGQTADVQQMLSSALAQSQTAMLQVANLLQSDPVLKKAVFGENVDNDLAARIVILSMLASMPDVNIVGMEITGITREGEKLFVSIEGRSEPIELAMSDIESQLGRGEAKAPAQIAPFTVRQTAVEDESILATDIFDLNRAELAEKADSLDGDVFKKPTSTTGDAYSFERADGYFMHMPEKVTTGKGTYSFKKVGRPYDEGSFGNVFEGETSDGQEVVAKVLYAVPVGIMMEAEIGLSQLRNPEVSEEKRIKDAEDKLAPVIDGYNRDRLMFGKESRFLEMAKGVPGIPEARDMVYYEKDGVRYYAIIMDKVEAPTLSSLMSKGEINETLAADIIEGLLGILDTIYSMGIIHADLKPDNILVEIEDGKLKKVHLIDFGVALYTADGKDVKVKGSVGTPLSSSPSSIIKEGGEYTFGEQNHNFSAAHMLFSMLNPGKELIATPSDMVMKDSETGEFTGEYKDWMKGQLQQAINILENSSSIRPTRRRIDVAAASMMKGEGLRSSAEAAAWLATARGNAVETGFSMDDKRLMFAMLEVGRGSMDRAVDYLLSDRALPGITSYMAGRIQAVSADAGLFENLIAQAAARGTVSEQDLAGRYNLAALENKNWVLGRVAEGASNEAIESEQRQRAWGALSGVAKITVGGKTVALEERVSSQEEKEAAIARGVTKEVSGQEAEAPEREGALRSQQLSSQAGFGDIRAMMGLGVILGGLLMAFAVNPLLLVDFIAPVLNFIETVAPIALIVLVPIITFVGGTNLWSNWQEGSFSRPVRYKASSVADKRELEEQIYLKLKERGLTSDREIAKYLASRLSQAAREGIDLEGPFVPEVKVGSNFDDWYNTRNASVRGRREFLVKTANKLNSIDEGKLFPEKIFMGRDTYRKLQSKTRQGIYEPITLAVNQQTRILRIIKAAQDEYNNPTPLEAESAALAPVAVQRFANASAGFITAGMVLVIPWIIGAIETSIIFSGYGAAGFLISPAILWAASLSGGYLIARSIGIMRVSGTEAAAVSGDTFWNTYAKTREKYGVYASLVLASHESAHNFLEPFTGRLPGWLNEVLVLMFETLAAPIIGVGYAVWSAGTVAKLGVDITSLLIAPTGSIEGNRGVYSYSRAGEVSGKIIKILDARFRSGKITVAQLQDQIELVKSTASGVTSKGATEFTDEIIRALDVTPVLPSRAFLDKFGSISVEQSSDISELLSTSESFAGSQEALAAFSTLSDALIVAVGKKEAARIITELLKRAQEAGEKNSDVLLGFAALTNFLAEKGISQDILGGMLYKLAQEGTLLALAFDVNAINNLKNSALNKNNLPDLFDRLVFYSAGIDSEIKNKTWTDRKAILGGLISTLLAGNSFIFNRGNIGRVVNNVLTPMVEVSSDTPLVVTGVRHYAGAKDLENSGYKTRLSETTPAARRYELEAIEGKMEVQNGKKIFVEVVNSMNDIRGGSINGLTRAVRTTDAPGMVSDSKSGFESLTPMETMVGVDVFGNVVISILRNVAVDTSSEAVEDERLKMNAALGIGIDALIQDGVIIISPQERAYQNAWSALEERFTKDALSQGMTASEAKSLWESFKNNIEGHQIKTDTVNKNTVLVSVTMLLNELAANYNPSVIKYIQKLPETGAAGAQSNVAEWIIFLLHGEHNTAAMENLARGLTVKNFEGEVSVVGTDTVFADDLVPVFEREDEQTRRAIAANKERLFSFINDIYPLMTSKVSQVILEKLLSHPTLSEYGDIIMSMAILDSTPTMVDYGALSSEEGRAIAMTIIETVNSNADLERDELASLVLSKIELVKEEQVSLAEKREAEIAAAKVKAQAEEAEPTETVLPGEGVSSEVVGEEKSKFMGKINGEVVTGDITVTDAEGAVTVATSSGESVTISKVLHADGPSRGKAITREPAEIVDTLNELVDNDRNSLTSEEKAIIRSFGDRLASEGVTEVVAIEDREDVFGFFGDGVLYLSRSLMDKENPVAFMGILHESGERGVLGLPEGYTGNAHTAWRGAGEKLRAAQQRLLDSIGIKALDDMVRKGEVGKYIDLLKGEMQGEMTQSEENLIKYNSTVIGERGKSPVGKSLSEMLLFGIQDHLDSDANYQFSQRIKELKEYVRRGGDNYHLMPAYNMFTKNIQAQVGRREAGDFEKIGVGTMFGQYSEEPGALKKKMEAMANLMLEGRFSQASIMVLTQEALNEAKAYIAELAASQDEDRRDLAKRFDVKFDNSYKGIDKTADEAMVNVAKLIAINTQILNIKRKRDDFNFDADQLAIESMLLLSFLSGDGFIDYIEGLDTMTTAQVAAEVNKLLTVGAILRVTGVDWQEIDDYQASMEAVRKSL